jgi:N-acetylglutamate synthase-like GNAT family acetyltransferase
MPPPSVRAASLGISYRAVQDDDEPFLRALYATTRAEELARTGWPEGMRAQFTTHQFDAQDRHYKRYHPDGEWLIVEREGERIGRLYLDESTGRLNLIDISLLPQAQGAGIGTAILSDLLDDVAGKGLSAILYVDPRSRAKALYSRLGFATVEEDPVHELMAWRPERAL